MEITPRPAKAVVVGCVNQKQPYRALAKDLYVSNLFRKRRAYAEASGLPWFILSAKYGIAQPDTVLEPYDETLDRLPRAALLRWDERGVLELERILGPLAGLVLEIHAGKRYVEGVESALHRRSTEVVVPLKGLRIGQQLQWYDRVTSAKMDQSGTR